MESGSTSQASVSLSVKEGQKLCPVTMGASQTRSELQPRKARHMQAAGAEEGGALGRPHRETWAMVPRNTGLRESLCIPAASRVVKNVFRPHQHAHGSLRAQGA